MLVHHFLGFPAWRVGGKTLELAPFIQAVAVQFKLCVGVFAVLTGYGWGCGSISVKKTLKRIGKIVLIYESCLIVVYGLNALIDPAFVSVGDILHQITLCFFGGTLLIGFAWYIQFFVLAALSYPILKRVLDACTNKWLQLAASIGPFWCAYVILGKLGLQGIWNGIVVGYLIYMPCILMGTWLQNYANEVWKSDKPSVAHCVLCMTLGAAVLCARQLTGGRLYLDVFFAPVFVYVLSSLYTATGLAKRNVRFVTLSASGTYMWLLHGIFYQTPGAQVFQRVLYISKSPIVICLWGYFLVFVSAFLLSFVGGWVSKRTAPNYCSGS